MLAYENPTASWLLTLRICLASLHPRILSGQIDSLVGLTRALRGRRHQVSLVAPFDTAQVWGRSLPEVDNGPQALVPAAFRMLAAIPRIVAAARGSEVLHLCLPTPAFSWIADVVQASLATPVLVSFEGHLVHRGDVRSLNRRRALTRNLPLWALNNRLVARASRFSCPGYLVSSQFQQSELTRLGLPARRIHVVPNIVDARKLHPRGRHEGRRLVGLDVHAPVVGYLGHLNDVKGVEILASAFPAVVARGRQPHLVLALSGQGDVRRIRSLLQPVTSRVHFLGKVDVGLFLAAVDVLALPYLSTSGQVVFPSVLIEALLASRPVVTTDHPVIREVVGNGELAALCPSERPDLLSERLGLVLGSQDGRGRMSERQIALAQSRFSSDVLVRRYERIYRCLASDQPQHP